MHHAEDDYPRNYTHFVFQNFYYKKYQGQQVKGVDPPSLLCPAQVSPGVSTSGLPGTGKTGIS